MHVRDEHGREWKVSGGDPASKPVNLCRRMGYETVVLPADVLRYGDMTPLDYLAYPEDYLDKVRLLDCMEVLSA